MLPNSKRKTRNSIMWKMQSPDKLEKYAGGRLRILYQKLLSYFQLDIK